MTMNYLRQCYLRVTLARKGETPRETPNKLISSPQSLINSFSATWHERHFVPFRAIVSVLHGRESEIWLNKNFNLLVAPATCSILRAAAKKKNVTPNIYST